MSFARPFSSQSRVLLPGSEKQPVSQVPPAVAPHATAAPEQMSITVLVRRKQPLPAAGGNVRVSHEEFDAQYGADPTAIAAVQDFAAEFGLNATPHPDLGRRHVTLTGTRTQFETAFGITLVDQVVGGKKVRVREGGIYLPEELIGQVEAVLGLDNRPQAKPHFRVAHAAKATNVSYTPVQVAQLYGFPRGATADGQTIGILELGGGYTQSDLDTFFQNLGLPVPTVTAVPVDGGSNAPGDPNGADGEVLLDIEVAASVASGAKVAVYFAPNTDQGFIDAISTAVHDTANKPSVLSISWGGPEASWTGQSATALDEACQSAAALGVTITVACGDNGSTDGLTDGANHVDFPASSPHVLACGGTKLTASGTTISSEVVWNELTANEGATGGGVSDLFPLPAWQQNANVPAPTASGGGRGVPDVAGDADPATGYQVYVDGQAQVIGGTSAVAPLWAGLIALANQQNGGSAGFINPTLYNNPAAFHDITQGDNPAFAAGPGWDACTGLGSPIGTAVVAALAPASSSAPAPTPVPPPTPTPTEPAPPDHHRHHHPKHSSDA